jgi:hypothetical protein
MNKFNKNTIAQSLLGNNEMLPAIPGAEAPINKEFATPEVPHEDQFDLNKETDMKKTNQFETTINIFEIDVFDYLDDVIVFRGDLTIADCMHIFETSVREGCPMNRLNDNVLMGAFMFYDSIDWEVTLLCGDDHYEERGRRHAISELRLYVLNNDIGIFPSNYKEEALPSLGGNILAEFCYQAVDQFDSYEEFFYEKEYCPHINKSAPPVPKDMDDDDIPF